MESHSLIFSMCHGGGSHVCVIKIELMAKYMVVKSKGAGR